MKGLKVAEHLAKAVDKYHGGAKEGPSGPEYRNPAEEADEIHHTDMDELQHVLCPACHSKLRGHIIAKQSKASPEHQAEVDGDPIHGGSRY